MVGVGVAAGSLMAWPQVRQNRAPGDTGAPHAGQVGVRREPQDSQNCDSSGLSRPQDEQSIVPPLVYAPRSKAIVRESSGSVNVAGAGANADAT
jgi:hypothetical protein